MTEFKSMKTAKAETYVRNHYEADNYLFDISPLVEEQHESVDVEPPKT